MLLLYILVSVVVFPFYAILIIGFMIYHKIVFMVLKSRHGEALVNLIGMDVFWAIGDPHHNIINVVVVLNGEGLEDDFERNIRTTVQERILNRSEEMGKLSSTLNYYSGYPYLLKQDLNSDEIITVIDVEKTSFASIEEIVFHYSNEPMPLDNTFLWEIVVIRASNDWKKRNIVKENQKIIFLRLNHAIADGLGILNLISTTLGENHVDIEKTLQHLPKSPYWTKLPLVTNFWKLFLFFLSPGYFIVNRLRRTMRDRKFWPVISTEHNISFRVEKDGENVIQNMKAIKKAIPNTSFTAVLLTAYSASLFSFLQKNYHTFPKSLYHGAIDVRDLQPLTVNGVPRCFNQFGWLPFDLPIKINSSSFLDRLQALMKDARAKESDIDPLIEKVLYPVLPFIPSLLLKYVEPLDMVWGSFSNLPVYPKVALFNGYEVENIFFFTPHRNLLGVGLSSFSYNSKLHLGFCADVASIASKKFCDEILDGIFTNIELMKAEVEAKKI